MPLSVVAHPLQGLSSRALKEAVASLYAPASTLNQYTGPGGILEALSLTHVNNDGTLLDPFSHSSFDPPLEGNASLTAVHLAPLAWWSLTANSEVDLAHDLHNMMIGPSDVAWLKSNYPPGTVDSPTWSNPWWSVGTGIIEGVEINLWQPPRGYEGDVARAYMYMATIYPSELWPGLAFNFMSDGAYPGLQPWAKAQLLAWHRADPVDETELSRSQAIASIQGNINPFVTMSELAEYLWGNLQGQPFEPEPDEPDTPEASPTPLQATYTLDDERIWLQSPYVPDDAVWTVDGVAAPNEWVAPASLGVGKHELRWNATDGSRGKITIEITATP
ncbi:MAG: endonuclease [Bacteroidales bacterium]|nr:endonuclease [Bacteroidales bacterium]